MTGMTQPNGSNARTRTGSRIIDGIDVAVGVIGIVAGIVVFLAPPPSFIASVAIPWLVGLWGWLFMIGGLGILIGRLTDLWLPETTGIIAVATAATMYAITLTAAASIKQELGTVVAIAVIAIGVALMVRRYVQLQMLSREPAKPGATLWQLLLDVLLRRTNEHARR